MRQRRAFSRNERCHSQQHLGLRDALRSGGLGDTDDDDRVLERLVDHDDGVLAMRLDRRLDFGTVFLDLRSRLVEQRLLR